MCFLEFEISEFEISRVDCIYYIIMNGVLQGQKMVPPFNSPSAAKVRALTLSVFTGVFLSEIILTVAQSESQLFFALHNFREPGNSSGLTQINARSAIGCCFACEKNTMCRAANFHSGNRTIIFYFFSRLIFVCRGSIYLGKYKKGT